ncbi:MAG: nuclease-related domain-containing protein [Salibacteraceae bacterium]
MFELILAILAIGLLVFFVPSSLEGRDDKRSNSVKHRKRGESSERDLLVTLEKMGIPKSTVFHDLYIEDHRGKSAQIDLVLITSVGIVVIEVKDYGGWIYGNANATNWTKVMAYGKNKYKFFNPIKQNAGHILKLKSKLLQFKNIPFFSVIVFYGDCELKEIEYVPENTFVTKQHRLYEVFRYIKKNHPLAPYTDKSEIFSLFQKAVSDGSFRQNQEKHITQINNLVGAHRVFK